MFSYSDLELKLNNSSWSPESKQSLSLVLPRLGRWALSTLNHQLGEVGSNYYSNKIAELLSGQPQWYQEILDHRADQIVSTLTKVIKSGSTPEKRMMLAVVLDIRYNNPVAAALTPQLSEHFDELELEFIKDLPYKEIARILNLRIDHLVKLNDAPMELKRYCYYRDTLTKEDEEIIAFRQALENNVQIFGGSAISVKDWLRDFLESSPSSRDHTAYNVAYYITNSPKVKKLSQSEKNALSDILKIYNWLFQPYTNSDEIESYESIGVSITSTQLQPKKAIKKRIDPVTPPPQPEPPVSITPLPRPTPVVIMPAKPLPVTPKPTKPPTSPAPRGTVANRPNHITNNAQIHALINSRPQDVRGIVRDATNIDLEAEKQRVEKERADQARSIQQKLADLKIRNKTKE